MPQKDNTTARKKISLRLAAMRELAEPSIVETHGGMGKMFLHCYSSCSRGVVFETDERKADRLAEQRPEWAVYQSDCVAALANGIGFVFQPNFFDLDPYGECWPVVDAVFVGMKNKPKKIVFAVNDGLRQKLKMNGGWDVASMGATVRKIGADKTYEQYLDICKNLMQEKAGQAGYALSRWGGYYCGHSKQMTHFAAVFTRSSAA